MTSVSRRRFAGALAVLAVDLTGVTTIALVASGLATTATDGAGRLESALVAVSAGVGSVAWVLALVAVIDIGRGHAPSAARRWLWAGLALNTIGALGVAITATVVSTLEPSAGFVVGVVLAVGGAVLSLAYLLLLRRDAPRR